MVQSEQWDTYWGPKKLIFLMRDIDGPAMTAASVESCRFVAPRSPGGRFWSVVDMRNRLRRMRGRFPLRDTSGQDASQPRCLHHKMPRFSIQSSLGSPKNRRMWCRRLPDPRPIPEGVREPIYVRKKCAIWARWRPVPVKKGNYPRAPSSRRSGLVGPHTTPYIYICIHVYRPRRMAFEKRPLRLTPE
jgi:hypothetical protein